LNSTNRHYDYIVLDVFNGDITPPHLLSVEALGLMRDRLTKRGVLAINLIGSLKRETFMTASVTRTLKAAFDQVGVFPVFDVEKSKDGIGNLAIMAYQGEPRPMKINQEWVEGIPDVVKMVIGNIGTKFEFPEDTPALVLSDDYNPIDFFDGWLRENVRRAILKSTDWDILIS
jgi:hypothetical protein